jgi:PAS domain S-box-containing protein
MQELRLILLEDDKFDYELTLAELSKSLTEYTFQVHWVTNRIDFLKALQTYKPDLVLSDYNLPQYNGMRALKDTQEWDPLLPFIFVTGELQEEMATDTIKAGAWEYVVKDRIFRLSIAIRNTLKLKEERQKRKKIEEENQRLALVANTTKSVVRVCDAQGRITWVNAAFVELTGYSFEEVKGKTISNFLYGPDTDNAQIALIANKILNGEGFKDFEILYYNKSRESFWVSVEIQPIRNGENEIIQFVIIESDITARKNAELALAAREKRLRNLIDQSPLAIIEWSNEMDIIEWNPAAEKIFGYKCVEVTGALFFENLVLSDERNQAKDLLNNLLYKHQSNRFVLRNINKLGEQIVCEWNNRPLIDEKGEYLGIMSMVEDITERRKSEEEINRKNEELTKINKELDKFVYSASHDLRAPISSLLGLIEVAKMSNNSKEEIFNYLDKQKITLKKMDEFIHEIVNYSRNGRLDITKEQIDFKGLVLDLFEQYNYVSKASSVKKELNITGDVPFFSDKQRISVILSNLISNSLKYSDLSKADPFVKVSIAIDTEKAIITVKDNGEGILPNYLDRIFEMFIRATSNSTGSGLGLYIVKEVLEKLQGTITVSSKLGKETEFVVVIPNLG